MGGFAPDFIQTVRDASDIARVVSDYVPLKPAGSRMKGLCPFHQEKTPSFSVDPSAQLFYCFGCQTGGDVFKFVQLYDKVDFPESVSTLARRFGVPLPEESRSDDPAVRVREMNRLAVEFFRTRLTRDEAGAGCRKYLAGRRLDDATLEKLKVGYAPESWDALRDHLVAKRYRPQEIVSAGLALPRKSGTGEYDRFRDRLIFPISDVNGRPVAFGGRILGDGQPKYINSPETPAYTKGDHLYGLDLAREAIRREGFAIVVEGYMDLAAVLQAGCDNVVATLGTAFTPNQARLLSRFTDRITVSYDGDAAGASATAKSLDLMLERGFAVRVVDLPGGADPDDYIKEHGAEAYDRLVRAAPTYLEFLVSREAASRDLARTEEKVAAANALLPHLAKLSNSIERAAWADRLSDALGIEEGLIQQELRVALRQAKPAIRQQGRRERPVPVAEARLVAVLLQSQAERERWAEELDLADLEGTQVARMVGTILDMTRKGKTVDHTTVLDELDDEADREKLTRIAFGDEAAEGPGVEDCLWACRRQRLQRQGRDTLRKIHAMHRDEEQQLEQSDVDRQLMEIQRLAQQRDALFNP